MLWMNKGITMIKIRSFGLILIFILTVSLNLNGCSSTMNKALRSCGIYENGSEEHGLCLERVWGENRYEY